MARAGWVFVGVLVGGVAGAFIAQAIISASGSEVWRPITLVGAVIGGIAGNKLYNRGVGPGEL